MKDAKQDVCIYFAAAVVGAARDVTSGRLAMEKEELRGTTPRSVLDTFHVTLDPFDRGASSSSCSDSDPTCKKLPRFIV